MRVWPKKERRPSFYRFTKTSPTHPCYYNPKIKQERVREKRNESYVADED